MLSLAMLLLLGATKPAPPPSLPFEKYQLPNGLTVILHEDHRLPLVAVSVWYDVGGLHEKTGRTGFAHLFEHMMFQGTPHVGEDLHFRRLQEIGATHINGTTEFDRTNYFETVPSNQLELALWLESDRMGFLLASLNEKSLQNQIDVVKNERRQSVENAPYGLMEELIVKTLYPPSHPYHGNVIGSMEDLGNATVQDVRDFFTTYYTPANATITIAGDLDPAATKKLIEKYFGTITGKPKPPKVEIPAPKLEQEKLIRFDEPVANLPKLSIVWMGPNAYEANTAELTILTHIISGTRSARLDKRVTYDDLIAQSVTARFEALRSGSTFEIDLVVAPNRTLEEAHKAVDEVLADFKKRPPTALELARAKNAFETHLFSSLEVLGDFSGRAERLQRYNHYLGDPGKLAWDVERFRKVTTKDVARAFNEVLGPNRLIVYATPMQKAVQQ
jgi:zinc protease